MTPWVQTYRNRAVDLLRPEPEMISVTDIAVGLAANPRFNGHTSQPWSIADHSMLTESFLPANTPPVTRLLVLLHDAHEAYTGDITTPVKKALDLLGAGGCVERLQNRLDRAIREAFGIPVGAIGNAREAISTCDKLALAYERTWFLPSPPRDWPLELLGPSAPFSAPSTFSPEITIEMFVERVSQLVQFAGLTPLPSLEIP